MKARLLRRAKLLRIITDLKAPNPDVRGRALAALQERAPRSPRTALAALRLLNDPHGDVRYHAFRILCDFCPPAEQRSLARSIESEDPEARLADLRGWIDRVPALRDLLSGWVRLRLAAVRDVGRILPVTTPGITEDDMPQPTEAISERPVPSPEGGERQESLPPGRWVAWDRYGRLVLGCADSYAQALKQAADSGEAEPVIRKTPGTAHLAARRPAALLPEESPDLLEDVARTFANPEAWLDAPNLLLGGRKPRDLVGTEEEPHVRDLLRGIRYGITT